MEHPGLAEREGHVREEAEPEAEREERFLDAVCERHRAHAAAPDAVERDQQHDQDRGVEHQPK